MSTDTPADNADLRQLQDIPVDIVLNSIDASLVHLPTYRELYYRWERQQWRTQDIDFIPDRIQWEDMSEEEHEGFLAGLASFYQGEASVTACPQPFCGSRTRRRDTHLFDDAAG